MTAMDDFFKRHHEAMDKEEDPWQTLSETEKRVIVGWLGWSWRRVGWGGRGAQEAYEDLRNVLNKLKKHEPNHSLE